MNAPRQRLYLITPLVDDAASFAAELERTLGSGDVAAVLLRLAQGGERSLIERVKTIGAAVQSRDIALLVDGHPEIVARAGADGSHLTGITAFAASLATLKPDRIAGAGGLRSRHDAMLAGETGAESGGNTIPTLKGGPAAPAALLPTNILGKGALGPTLTPRTPAAMSIARLSPQFRRGDRRRQHPHHRCTHRLGAWW